ncbi:MAG: polymorphic toxin type 44 domain-containing protein, partial [Enterobacter sp.]|uniref:polymorphic toxin type 44 domain-containing protein n=1 Tax=Enterobacter sp. TaxID=42895 RepID=UPI002913F59C
ACVEQDDKGWDARKRAYCLKIQPATGSFARNLNYSTKPNFHYGAVGYAACIPEKILLIAAGAAQWKAGTSRPEWGNFTGAPPFGDDPMDQFWIKQGIDYVKQHHY